MISVTEINAQAANSLYCRLPTHLQIATLSPEYVMVDALRDKSLRPIFLECHEGDKFWLLNAHAMNVPNSEYIALSSPYGYGGPLANTQDIEFLHRAVVAYNKWCWDRLVLCEVFKLHPLVNHPYGGIGKFNRFVYVAGTDHTPSCRNKISKARRHRLVCDQVNRNVISLNFPLDYWKAMEDVKADPFYLFPQAYFDGLAKMEAAVMVVCEDQENCWRSASIMLAGGDVMESHLTITNARGKEMGATNWLVHCMRETLRDDHKLYLGGGKTPSDHDALGKFKASFGGDAYKFYIGHQIHRYEAYREMNPVFDEGKVLFWR